MSFNKIILVGNLGRDPELRYTPQGVAVCDFTMAINERRRDKSGDFVDVPMWFKVTLWRNLAENAAKYLKKGQPVYIEGRLSVEDWTDRDGNARYTLAVQASEMHFLSRSSNEDFSSQEPAFEPPRSSGPEQSGSSAASADDIDDDIPF